ncbi:DMT family transporter [Silicimonas sp. MF1-12-2]|uniref:DMT family transporter n=1 Tax=Silicimonas sp. MF1-12-2 TaxID=3384793 RepID=UPI0039B45454
MTEGSRPLLAAAWMTGAIISFSSMAVAGRALSGELDTFEMMMYRSFIGLAVVLVFGLSTGKLREVRFDRLPLHLLRNIAHFTGQNLWFYSLTLITLAQVFALEFTSPIWVVVFAVLFLGEKLTRVRTLAVVLGFLGALAVARPGAGGDPLGLALAASSALGFACSIVCTKLLTRTETILGILFWLTAMQAVMGLIATGWDGDIAWPSAAAWPWVALIGCAGLVAHTCLTNALAVAPATVVTPMDFLRLPVIALVGMLFYGEPLDVWVFAGAALIFGGNYLNIWSESRRHRG